MFKISTRKYKPRVSGRFRLIGRDQGLARPSKYKPANGGGELIWYSYLKDMDAEGFSLHKSRWVFWNNPSYREDICAVMQVRRRVFSNRRTFRIRR